MQKISLLFICVLALLIIIEAKPWCGLNGCDSVEQNEEGGSGLHEDESSESNENEPDQNSYAIGDQGIYNPGGNVPSGYVPVGHVPVGHIPGGDIPGGYLPSRYVPGGYIPVRYVPSGYVTGEYVPVYIPGDHGQGGYIPGGVIPGGFIPSGRGQGVHGPGNLSIDIYLRNFNNGRRNGIGGVASNEIGGHANGGPCGIGGNLPCDGRQPLYPYDNGMHYVFVPKDCPNCNIRSFGDGENNVNNFNLPKKAYD